MNSLLMVTYNIILLSGTVYLVGWQGWNPWWFLFTALFLIVEQT